MDRLLESFDEKLVTEAEEILDNFGLDVVTAIRILLKRIRNERNVNFLLSNAAPVVRKEVPMAEGRAIQMTKSKAIALLKSEGCTFPGYTTYASKNKGACHYWANPGFEVLERQWNLILNDWIRQEIHLFLIPSGAIPANRFVCRADKVHQIDLQIMYDDCSFTDSRSKISFAPYLVKSLKY